MMRQHGSCGWLGKTRRQAPCTVAGGCPFKLDAASSAWHSVKLNRALPASIVEFEYRPIRRAVRPADAHCLWRRIIALHPGAEGGAGGGHRSDVIFDEIDRGLAALWPARSASGWRGWRKNRSCWW
jgi:hypothetical protein